MSNEEARRILLSDADFSGAGEKAKLTADALCVAVDALEKQIPMKPRITPYEKAEGHGFSCMACTAFGGYVGLNRWQNYCPHCGQAIDWSDVEPNGKLKEA